MSRNRISVTESRSLDRMSRKYCVNYVTHKLTMTLINKCTVSVLVAYPAAAGVADDV